MNGVGALSQPDLSTLLAFGSAARHIKADTRQDNGAPLLTRLILFVNDVEGLQRGVYAFADQNNALCMVQNGDLQHPLEPDDILISPLWVPPVASKYRLPRFIHEHDLKYSYLSRALTFHNTGEQKE